MILGKLKEHSPFKYQQLVLAFKDLINEASVLGDRHQKISSYS
jgi:hypothetical protein